MKYSKVTSALLMTALMLTSRGVEAENLPIQTAQDLTAPSYDNTSQIFLSDLGITLDGSPVSSDNAAAVYAANDIVYYESGKDFTYGEGSEKDAHSPEEAAAHTVLHITKPGVYSLSGKLSQGQIAVDLGADAEKDPDAVVTLVLNGIDITCEVAPAVIFYNVYECGDDDAEKSSPDVDTALAGANVIIADGSVNTVNGSYVERIYKPDSVVLNDDKTEIVEAGKLHKYDAAFYSRQSMNIFGGEKNTGILNIRAENEGLDSELHLTINGGVIYIESGNDGINTNEDGVSVTTVNGGKLSIKVTGATGEGDGIDSNGWLVINGGTVIAAACADSADAGIDSDMGIHINGGTLTATGSMLDRIEDSGQNYAVLQFAQKQSGGEAIMLKDLSGNVIWEATPENAYSTLIFSTAGLTPGTYTLWCSGRQLACTSGGMMHFPGERSGMNPPGRPDNMQQPPEGFVPPEGFIPPHEQPFSKDSLPHGTEKQPPFPDRGMHGRPDGDNAQPQECTVDFVIQAGGNMFNVVSDFSEDSAEH